MNSFAELRIRVGISVHFKRKLKNKNKGSQVIFPKMLLKEYRNPISMETEY